MNKILEKNNEEILFVIDNTRYEVLLQFIFVPFAYLLFALLFITVGYSDIKSGISNNYSDFFITQLSNGRFLSIILIFFIIAPILMFIEIKKISKKDNKIYFLQSGIYYKDSFLELSDINNIQICWYCLNGGIWRYIFAYIFLGFMFIPFKIFEIFIFYWMKFIGNNNLKKLSYKFGILLNKNLANGSTIIYGYCYDEITLQKLIAFKKQIDKGEK